MDGTTATSGNILVADGADFESVALSGDVTMNASGVVTVADNSIDGTWCTTCVQSSKN